MKTLKSNYLVYNWKENQFLGQKTVKLSPYKNTINTQIKTNKKTADHTSTLN